MEAVLGTRAMHDPPSVLEFLVEECPGGDFTVVVVDVAGNRVSLGPVLRVNEIQAHWVRERFAEAYKLSVEE